MSDIEVEDRGSVLDAFAKGPSREASSVPALTGQIIPPPRIVGAQKVAVLRDERAVLEKIKFLAGAAGDDWYYRFPVKNRRENRTDYIEGPSIKLANDLARIYGNCEVDCHVQDFGDTWMIYARFTDFETGFSLVRPFQQRKSQSSVGGGDAARALDIALQIGASKAIRNVVCNALQTFADFAFQEAKNSLVEKIGKNLPNWRTRVRDRIAEQIDPRRVEVVIGRTFGEMLAPDIAKVVAMAKSVQDGMASWDETFPPIDAQTGEVLEDEPKEDKMQGFADAKTTREAEAKKAEPVADKPADPAAPAEQAGPAQAAEANTNTSNLEAAYQRGRTAREKGQARRAVPGEFRDKPALAEAWVNGWDARAQEIGGAA